MENLEVKPVNIEHCLGKELYPLLKKPISYLNFPSSIGVGHTPFFDWLQQFRNAVKSVHGLNEFSQVLYWHGDEIYSGKLNEWCVNSAEIDQKSSKYSGDATIAYNHDHEDKNTFSFIDVYRMLVNGILVTLATAKTGYHMSILSNEGMQSSAVKLYKAQAPCTSYDGERMMAPIWKQLMVQFGKKIDPYIDKHYWYGKHPYPEDANEAGKSLLESMMGIKFLKLTQLPLYFCRYGEDEFHLVTDIGQIYTDLQ